MYTLNQNVNSYMIERVFLNKGLLEALDAPRSLDLQPQHRAAAREAGARSNSFSRAHDNLHPIPQRSLDIGG